MTDVAEAAIRELQEAITSASARSDVPIALENVIAHDYWRGRVDERNRSEELKEFVDFVEAKRPVGLDTTIEALDEQVKSYPHIRAQLLEIVKTGQRGGDRRSPTKRDNIPLEDHRGTAKDQTLRRLHRDHSDLYNQVLDGELSANAAAIQAGFRRPTRSVPIDSAESAIRALARVFDAAELRKAVDAL